MNSGFETTPWKNFLPKTYTWLESLQLSFGRDIFKADGSLHIIPVTYSDDQKRLEIKTSKLDGTQKASLIDAASLLGWPGKAGNLRVAIGGVPAALVALPSLSSNPVQRARQWGIDIAKLIKDSHFEKLSIYEPTPDYAAVHVLDGMFQALYECSLFKGSESKTSKHDSKALPKNIAVFSDSSDSALLESVRHRSRGIALTMMLQDLPPNYLTPVKFGEIAMDLAKDLGVKGEAWGREKLAEQKMGSYLSVANGSNIEPRLITIEIPGKDSSKTVALIGKGLTFDSGGISIKPSLGMGEMKYDMSGGAAVLGCAAYLAKQKPEYNVVCIIGAVENMPGWYATRPSDIVKSMSGKTIEIQNTDAEGRLVLCDLLTYAKTRFKPSLMVDIATLTGAVLYALGHAGAAVMSNAQNAADFCLKSSQEAGEPMWQLPLWPEIAKEIKSEIADIVNIAKPNVLAGTVVGGAFLQEFVGDTPWLHLDIAGTAWQCSATGYPSGGASAFGMRLMSHMCLKKELPA